MKLTPIRMSDSGRCRRLPWSVLVTLASLLITQQWLYQVLAGGAAPSTLDKVIISGTVMGGSGKHVIFVALWDEAGFLEHPVQQVRIERQPTPSFRFEVPTGHWAVSAFEDLNDNGVLDMGMFGPKEPNGFWRQFRAWRKPRFADVESLIERDTDNADIKLRK